MHNLQTVIDSCIMSISNVKSSVLIEDDKLDRGISGTVVKTDKEICICY